MRAARAGAWIGLRGFAPLQIGHAALQLVMHAGLHAVHGLLPPQAYLQFISSFSKSMHWVALASTQCAHISCIFPACVACAHHWRYSRELRRICKEVKEVQKVPLAERDAHDALMQNYAQLLLNLSGPYSDRDPSRAVGTVAVIAPVAAS